jgi:hypothetical protein
MIFIVLVCLSLTYRNPSCNNMSFPWELFTNDIDIIQPSIKPVLKSQSCWMCQQLNYKQPARIELTTSSGKPVRKIRRRKYCLTKKPPEKISPREKFAGENTDSRKNRLRKFRLAKKPPRKKRRYPVIHNHEKNPCKSTKNFEKQ